MTQQLQGLVEKRDFRWFMRWCLHQGHLVVSGLFMAALAGQGLVEERYPSVRWYWLVILPFSLWYLWAEWPGRWAELQEEELKRSASGGAAALLLWIPCFFVLYWQRAHTWSVVAIGVVSALAVGTIVKARHKSAAVTVIGWTVAIPIVFRLAWPNSQRFMLVLTLGGLFTALQGGFNFVRAVKSLRTSSNVGALDSR